MSALLSEWISLTAPSRSRPWQYEAGRCLMMRSPAGPLDDRPTEIDVHGTADICLVQYSEAQEIIGTIGLENKTN